jgi:hypothetical protein
LKVFWKSLAAAALLTTGFLLGHSLRPAAADPGGGAEAEPRSASRMRVERRPAATLPVWSPSTDTFDNLTNVPGDELYGRLARWLMDAPSHEIAAFRERYRGREEQSREITRLILLAWTRIDPRAALAAVKGTEDEREGWEAWACHDPAAALDAAAREGRLAEVGRGIGRYRAAWLRTHLEALPEEARRLAILSLASDPSDRPQEDLDLIRRESGGQGINVHLFSSFATEDPWAARQWLGEQRFNDFEEKIYWETMIDAMASVPERVARALVASMPEGRLKRKADLDLFQRCLESDPEAVLAELDDTSGSLPPVVATTRRALAGRQLVEVDPEAAFAIAAEMFRDPDHDPASMGEHPRGSENEVADVIDPFIAELMLVNPGRTLDLLMPSEVFQSRSFNRAQMEWAQRDPDTMAVWVETVENPEIQNSAAADVVMGMGASGRFQDAMEWAVARGANAGGNNIWRNAMNVWTRNDPQEARAWWKAAELPPDLRSRLESQFSESP